MSPPALIPSRSHFRLACCCGGDPVSGESLCLGGEVVEAGAHVDRPPVVAVGQRHVDRAARLVAARRRPGLAPPSSGRAPPRTLHLHRMRAVAVPEHQLRPAGRERLGGLRQPRRQRLVHQAARVRRVQRLADEVVRRRVAQVDDGVGDDAADVDEAGLGRRRRLRTRNWRAGDGPSSARRKPLRACALRRDQASVKLRVTAGSTGMPGPVVVETTIFFR